MIGMKMRLLHRAGFVLLVLFCGLSIGAPAYAAVQSVHPKPAHSAKVNSPPPAPAGVKATRQSDQSVQITWVASKVPGGKVGGYIVDRNGRQLTQLPADGSGGPVTYTDPHPPTGTLTYDVRTYNPLGLAGQPSAGAQLAPLPASANPTSGTQNSGGGYSDMGQQALQGHNAPTAYELYGPHAGNIHQTYGWSEDIFNRAEMSYLQIWWSLIAMHSYMALSFLAWGITRKFYAPLVGVVTPFVQTFFHLPVYSAAASTLFMLGVMWLTRFIFKARWASLGKGIAILMVGAIGMTAYANSVPTVVQDVMNYPVAVGDYALGLSDQLLPAGHFRDFGLKVDPTYRGDPVIENARAFQTRDWEENVYPAFCKLNFGDVGYATTKVVPVDTSLSGSAKQAYTGLTVCEYYLKTIQRGDKNEDGYLTKWILGNNGAPQQVQDFFQGNDLPDHYSYAFFITWVLTLRSLTIDLLALSFVFVEILMALALIELALYGVAFYFEPLRGKVNGLLYRTIVSAQMPGLLALLAVGALALSNGVYLAAAQGWSWMTMMFFQFSINLVALVGGVRIWRWHKQRRKMRYHFDGTASPRGRGGAGAGQVVISGAKVAAAGAVSGGTMAAAVAASEAPGLAQRQAQPLEARVVYGRLDPPKRPELPSGGNGSGPGPNSPPPVIQGKPLPNSPPALPPPGGGPQRLPPPKRPS
jgi:hypothetical protein